MTTRLNQELGSDIFVAVNAMEMQNDFFANPKDYGMLLFSIALPFLNNYCNYLSRWTIMQKLSYVSQRVEVTFISFSVIIILHVKLKQGGTITL